MKRIRAALFALAVFIGGMAAAGAQSAGPGETWHGYVLAFLPEGLALLETVKTHAEMPMCEAAIAISVASLTDQGVVVLESYCSTSSPEAETKALKHRFAPKEPA